MRWFVSSGCFLLMMAAGCMAQSGPARGAGATADSQKAAQNGASNPGASVLNRKIEVMIRSELNVPPEYQVTIGTRQKSDLVGYDTIPVTFSLPGRTDSSETVDFLLSKDGSTLARLSKWDIAANPEDGLPTDGRPVRGDPQAKVTVVNFDDLECPFCARMHAVFFPQTLEHYKGLVKFVYVDFPLTEIHPWAMHAAVNANCLAAQSPAAYWNYVDYLHTHGQDVTGPDNDVAKSNVTLDKMAREQGEQEHVDAGKLDACLAKQDSSRVQAEMKAGDKLGVNATPTFFVDGERWSGQLGQRQLWTMIDRALRAKGITPPADSTSAAAAAPLPSSQGQR